MYLSEAEPFLEKYARRSPQNQVLIGAAGNLVNSEDFLAIIEGGRDEEGDLEPEKDVGTMSPNSAVKEAVTKDEGLIVFFPGIDIGISGAQFISVDHFAFRIPGSWNSIYCLVIVQNLTNLTRSISLFGSTLNITPSIHALTCFQEYLVVPNLLFARRF